MSSIKKDIIARIYIAFIIVCLLGVAIVTQTFSIQNFHGAELRQLADSLTTDYLPIDAERGNVLSEDGRLLATSLPFFEVRVDLRSEALTDKTFYQSVDSLALCLSQFDPEMNAAQHKRRLLKARSAGNRYLLIAKNITYPELQQIKSFPMFRLGRYKGGLIVNQINKRSMPFRMLAHRTIGYVRDDIQPVGLEGSFNEVLSGVKGKRLMQRIAGGTWIPINDETEINSENGKDIVTTIDINLQDVTENALLKAIKKHNADHGTAIVMEVKTGKIKAIANIGRTGQDEYWEKYNYAVGEATEPGSTMKLAAMIALLEDNYIKITDSIDLEKGVKEFHDVKMYDSEEHDYGFVSIKTAFEISSNVGISKLVDQYYGKQPQKYVDHLTRMRLDKKLGVEIRGEATPVIKGPEDKSWSGITLPWMSVGYELMVTPLQMLTFYNAVANNGKMLKPFFVSQVQQYGEVIKTYEPQVLIEKICSDQTLGKVQLMLEGVVENGTAKHLKSKYYKFAGKTGTAKIADKKHGYMQKQVYQASFAGYFPADDPIYSCIVVVNSPRNGVYYGGYVAGPVFREIADKVFANNWKMHEPSNKREQYLADKLPGVKSGYKKDAKVIYNVIGVSCNDNHKAQWVSIEKNNNSMDLEKQEVEKGVVPDVRGMGLRDALYLLENEGLDVSFTGKGTVTWQSVRYGTRVTKGRKIELKLG